MSGVRLNQHAGHILVLGLECLLGVFAAKAGGNCAL